jgi:hypothetical protein
MEIKKKIKDEFLKNCLDIQNIKVEFWSEMARNAIEN